MAHSIQKVLRWDVTFLWDDRSQKLSNIQAFLLSPAADRLVASLEWRVYVALGGDGLFVYVAKMAHRDNAAILGINFATKGFLLQDLEIFSRENLTFETREYPMLHAHIQAWEQVVSWYAFNEVFLTRAGDSGAIRLTLRHKQMALKYTWDGIMISTPAGSTGWCHSYGGVMLPHGANLNAITPVGCIAPKVFAPSVLTDKWRIRIHTDATRNNPIDILLDNQRIIAMQDAQMHITIERDSVPVRVLIEKSYLTTWETKGYQERGFE